MKQQETTRDRYSGERANKPSQLLSPDENDQVYALLGRKCQTMCTAVAQVYQTEGSSHSIWKKKHTGALCFVRDCSKRSYFMRMYCLLKNELVWEHEIYDPMTLTKARPYLLTYEGQDGYVGLNFASDDECETYHRIASATIEGRNRKRQGIAVDRRSRSRAPGAGPAVPTAITQEVEDQPKVNLRNHPQISSVNITPSNNASTLKPIGNAVKDKKKSRRFTKSDISNPTNFVHVSHVGWNAQKGFDLSGNEDDEMLKHFFNKAGVSEQQLKDRDTRAFIYDFVKNHDVLASVKSEQVEKPRAPIPPPVPSRHQAQQPTQNGTQRTAPPPPPPPTRQPPPPLPTTTPPARGPPPSRPPPIHSNNISAPAPPPPPPPPQLTLAPPPPPMPQKNHVESESSPASTPNLNDNRCALMESIRKGTTLKKIDQAALSTGSSDSRSDLMSEIRQGFELRPAQNRELASGSTRSSDSGGTDALADALRRALQDRGRAIHSSDDNSDGSSENDGEWED